MHRGFIKIWRKIEDWEWINNPNVLVVWVHCLRLANWEDKKWQGQTIKKGSFITSYPNLAEICGLSVQNVRTSLTKLKSTGELTVKTTSKYSHISINNYDEYNETNTPTNIQPTDNQQTTNRQLTTTKEYKNEKNEKKYSTYASIGESELVQIAEKYSVSLEFVKGRHEEMGNWLGAKGKRYKDYYLALCNWVRRDYGQNNHSGFGQGRKIAFIPIPE